MSQTQTEDNVNNDGSDDERQQRHEAVRVFAAELEDAEYQFKTSDSEMAPNYTLLPTGQRVNRVLFVGVLTQAEERENGFVTARVYDGRDNFFISASQTYQAEPASTLRDLETPTHVAVVGKPSHWETDEGEHRVTIRPETVTEVTVNDQYQWVLEAAEQTQNRATALQSFTAEQVEAGSAPKDVQMAHEQYDAMPGKYVQVARDVLDAVLLSDGDAVETADEDETVEE